MQGIRLPFPTKHKRVRRIVSRTKQLRSSRLRRCLGLPAALLIFVTQAFFLASMDPMTPLLAAALAGIVNFGGDVLLVCLLNKGIAGAAFATAVAQASSACVTHHSLTLLRTAYEPG